MAANPYDLLADEEIAPAVPNRPAAARPANPYDAIPDDEPAPIAANPYDAIPDEGAAPGPAKTVEAPKDLLGGDVIDPGKQFGFNPLNPNDPTRKYKRRTMGLRTIYEPVKTPEEVAALVTPPDQEKSMLGLSPEKVMTGAEMTEATGIPTAITVPVSAVTKAAAGLGQFLTSPHGVGETALSTVPVYGLGVKAKWIADMASGVGQGANEIWEGLKKWQSDPSAFTTEEAQALAEHTANTLLMLYGAGHLTSGEVSKISGVRSPLGRLTETKKKRFAKDVAQQLNQSPMVAPPAGVAVSEKRNLPSPEEAKPAEAVAPVEAPKPTAEVTPTELSKFSESFESSPDKLTNTETQRAGMAVKSIADLEAMLALSRKAKSAMKTFKEREAAGEKVTPEERAKAFAQSFRVQLPREVIEQAVNIGGWTREGNLRGLKEFEGVERPLDWKKNPEVNAWLRKNSEELWPGKPFEEISGEIVAETLDAFKKREDARKASLANQGAGKPPEAVKSPVVGEPPAVPAAQVAEAVKASPQGVDVTHLNKADRRTLRLQGIELTQQPDGKLMATLPVKKAKATPAPKAPQPKRMAEISEPDKLVWYKTNPKYLATLTKRLGQKGLTEKYVLDSISDNGRIAFTEAIDPKLAEFLRLKAEPVPKVKGENLFAVRKQFTDLIQEWGERMGFVKDMNRYAAAMTKETGENQGTLGIRGKIENDRIVKAVHEAILKDLGLDPADKSLQAFSKALPLLKAKVDQFKALEENFLAEDNFAKTRLSTEDLSVGDTLKSNGVAAEVIAIQADGSVRLKSDAIGEQKLKPGQNIWLDITDSKVAKSPKYEAEIVEEPGAMDVEIEKAAEAPEQKHTGMGAAVPEEFAGEGGDYVSNMFAAIDRDRAAMGKPPMAPGEPRTWDTDNQIALSKMNREPDWIPRLLAEVKANPRPLLSWENAGVVWYRARLRAEANNALARVNRAYEDGNAEAKLDAQLDAARFEGELMDLDATVGRGGTGSEAGRTLQAQKMGAGDDFTLVEMRMQRRALENDGAPLTDKQEAEVKALHDKLKATQEAFDKYVKEQAEKESGRLAREALEEIERQRKAPKASSYVIQVAERWVADWDKSAEAAHARIAKRLGRTGSGPDPSQLPGMIADLSIVGRSVIGHIGLDVAKFGEAMIAKFGDFVKPHIQKIFDASKALIEKSAAPKAVKETITAPKPPKVKDMTSGQRRERLLEQIRDKIDQNKFNEITPQARKLAREAAEEGFRGYEAIGNYVHEALREIDPEITLTDTYNAVSGYGKFKTPAMDEISVAVGEASREMLQVRKIEDIEANQKPKPTGIGRREPSDVERAKIKLVNELKKKHPELFEGSGLKSALESRKTYYRNRMSDLREEISNRELAIKNKTAPPVDAELQAIKAEYETVKAEHDAMFKKGITDAERLRLALSGVERQMAELQRKISTKDFSKRKPSPIAKAPALVKLKAQRDLLRDEFNELRDLNEAYQREQAAKKLERDKASLERAIAEAERKIKSGDLTPQAKPVSRPAVPELEVLKQRLEALQKQIAEARKPVRSEADILLSQFKARRARQIADWERRMAEGDFSKKARKEIRMDREANELQGQAEKVKNEYLKARWEWMQAQRSTGRKIWDAIQKTRGATVNIASSFDFSALRQAALAIMSNITRLATDPVTGARMLGRPAKDMFRAWASDRAARGIEQQIRNRPNALSGADKIAKIEYSDLDSNKFTKYEENAHSILDEWAELPFKTGNRAKSIVTAPFKAGARGVRMSNRAFITYLNQTRAMLFDELLRVNFKDRPPTKAELELIGNMVNIATGRGKMKPVTAQVSSEVLWAPKLLASRVQFLTGQPLWTGEWANSSRGRMIVAKEYARIIAGGLLLATVSRMFSDKNEDDPRSSDFGKIVRGNTRIDPWGGLQQVTTLGARLGTASTKTLKGATRDVGINKRYGQRSPWYIALDFIRSKLRPDVGTAVDIINRADFTGKPVTPGSVAKNLFVPLPMREIVSVMRENGFTEGMIIEALGQFGAGVSVYEDKESQR